MPNSITIWQTFRDAYSKSVIFGQQDPGEALDGAAQKIDQLVQDGHDRRAASRPTGRILGEHPVGTAFVTPYVVFLAAIFAYPLGFAVYMSFHDYFFAAPGRDRGPAVGGVRELRHGADGPRRPAVVPATSADLPGHQRAADGRCCRSGWRPR